MSLRLQWRHCQHSACIVSAQAHAVMPHKHHASRAPAALAMTPCLLQVFDADGSGKLSKQEAMVAFYNIVMTLMIRCGACKTSISPWTDVGYCCKDCRTDPTCQDTPETWFDLCSSCHSSKVCPKHSLCSTIVPASTVRARPESAPHVLLAAPGLNDDPDAPEHSIPCLCCGEVHTIVLSYLRSDLQDLHMRPITVPNLATGELSGTLQCGQASCLGVVYPGSQESQVRRFQHCAAARHVAWFCSM